MQFIAVVVHLCVQRDGRREAACRADSSAAAETCLLGCLSLPADCSAFVLHCIVMLRLYRFDFFLEEAVWA